MMNRSLALVSLAVISISLFNCSDTSYRGVSSSGAIQKFYSEPEVITTSLFDAKDRTLSEESIQRLLNGRIVLRDTIRIAIYRHGVSSITRYYDRWWLDEEYLKMQQKYVDTLMHQVSGSTRVRKVMLMPSMVVSSQPSLNELREATVRLQADMLLIFSTKSDIYYKYKLFKEDEAKAFATTEAILMDIRTGVIPHSTIVTRESFLKKGEGDLTTDELRKRTEMSAILASLVETGNQAATFLNQK